MSDFLDMCVSVVVVLLVLVFVIGAAYTAIQVGYALATEERCVRAGYPQGGVTWNFKRYCGARIEQTDVVLPLEEAEKKPRR